MISPIPSQHIKPPRKVSAPMRLHSLTQRQIQYLKDESARFYILCPGRRARKTLISMRKVIWGPRGAVKSPGQRFFLGAPTRQQAKDIFWGRLKRETKVVRLKIPNETELMVELMNGSQIRCIGLDKPQRLEGVEWNGCHVTEFANVKPEAWGENIYPAIADTEGYAILDSVPEGRNHYYDLALYSCGGVIPESFPIQGAKGLNENDLAWVYYHWFSSDVLSEESIRQAKMNLDERTYQQEFEGQFVGYAGLAYYAFSEENMDFDLQWNEGETVHVGMDFNVNPMTATLNHVRGDEVLQFGEVYLNNSNTFEMCEHLLKLFPANQAVVYPDSTGKHESSNAQRSDIAILRKSGFRISTRSVPPRIQNRVNAVNSLHKTFEGKTRYKINPRNCPKTVNDWNKVERLDDGRLDKSQEGAGLKHISDAEGYLIDMLFPIQRTIATSVQA